MYEINRGYSVVEQLSNGGVYDFEYWKKDFLKGTQSFQYSNRSKLESTYKALLIKSLLFCIPKWNSFLTFETAKCKCAKLIKYAKIIIFIKKVKDVLKTY